jgi:hypothetical protein
MVSGDNGLGPPGLDWGEFCRCLAHPDGFRDFGMSTEMSRKQQKRTLAGAALLLAAIALAGCSTSISEMQLGNASPDAHAKEQPTAYLPVNELPPARDETAMDTAERTKVQKELIAAREHQASAAAAKGQAPTPEANQAQNQAQAQVQAQAPK